ncbi:hypothetical protein VTI28DRAFT_2348 [Corynascus sepedonium]
MARSSLAKPGFIATGLRVRASLGPLVPLEFCLLSRNPKPERGRMLLQMRDPRCQVGNRITVGSGHGLTLFSRHRGARRFE